MSIQITAFRASWNQGEQIGLIDIQGIDNQTRRFQSRSPEEFNAVLSILNGSETAYYDEHGNIFTGPEIVQE